MEGRQFTHALPDGRELQVRFPNLAEQANGEALVTLGGTVVLVTAVMKEAREGVGFFPLMVEFEERFYASGEMRTSRFIKREARPSDEAVLAGRLVDRTIRPRFPKGMKNEIQVVATTLSYDGENDPDVLAILGASAALTVSDIPWDGPIAAVRVGRADGTPILYPTTKSREVSEADIVVAGTKDRINMMEGGLNELPEQDTVALIGKGHEEVITLCGFLAKIGDEVGKQKSSASISLPEQSLLSAIRTRYGKELEAALFETPGKVESQSRLRDLEEKVLEELTADKQFDAPMVRDAFEHEIDRAVHEAALQQGKRADGRRTNEIRTLSSEAGLLPRTHGSSLFVRGTTKALATVTLAGPGEQQLVETMEGEWKKHFMLHYNFPPFSVGDIKPFRGPGRREIGHGALAERALAPMIPDKQSFPYTIRVVSEILSSNGSSSMATVCAGTLALMDAGVPIKKPVAGIAMGLMMSDQKHVVLTDIQGPEDHHGDMDCKIAGTKDGITAIQMDVKIEGVTLEIVEKTFLQAREALSHIFVAIEKTLNQPRPEVREFAPKVLVLTINPERIRDVIGPGGRVINTIIEETGAAIDVEQDGTVYVASADKAAAQKALDWINNLTREIEPGEKFEGTVTRFFPFGVMVEIMPDKEGLIHISELGRFGVERPEDSFKPGETIPVVVKEIDDQGRVNLAPGEGFKLQEIPGWEAQPRGGFGRNNGDRGGRGGYGGGRRPFGGHGRGPRH